MLYQDTFTGPKTEAAEGKPKFPAVPLNFGVNRFGILIHTFWWFVGLVLVAYIFLFPHFAGVMPSLDHHQFPVVQDYGNAVYFGLGIALVALFSFYLAVLLRPVFTRGPLYKVDIRGIQFNQADGTMLPASAIRSVFLSYTHGLANGVIIEVNDPERLKQLKKKLPPFSPVTFDFPDRSMTISLAGLKKKMVFVGAVQYLCARQRRHSS